MDNNEIAELLETTADRYESGVYEWIKGDLVDGLGGYCSVGALSHAAAGQATYNIPVVMAAAKSMMRNKITVVNIARREANQSHNDTVAFVEKFSESILVTWNDRFAKEKAEVVELMKQTAKNLRNSDGPATS